MPENNYNINQKSKILLARNTPVALVVGAASFFGSHLTDKLLQKEIQVIGADDLNEEKKSNLAQATESKNFHHLDQSPLDLDLAIDRLDYIFLLPQKIINISKVLAIFKKFKARLLLISSIDLYKKTAAGENLKFLKQIEEEVARFAKEHNLNARILRLGAVFGPRMSFDPPAGGLDPLIKLIQQSLTQDLQKEISLDYSTRALFIDDAVKVAIKCILAGATAQKIFDGVLPAPIKISEIKQILLDPVWYENRSFTPSELPPWPTPNLEKTIKFLHWQPETKLVSSLKETLAYFKDNEIEVPELEAGNEEDWKKEKEEELKGLKDEKKIEKIKKTKKGTQLLFFFLGLSIIIYALIFPIFQLSWAVYSFRFQLLSAVNGLEKGEFEQSLSSINKASDGIIQAKSIFNSLEPLRSLGIYKSQFDTADQLINIALLSTDAARETTLGIQALIMSLKSITGELDQSPADYLTEAKLYLQSADDDLSKAEVLISSQDFKSSLPKMLNFRISSWSERLSLYANLVKKGRALVNILPEIVGLEGSKNYLILLQNNGELRPTGGFINSFAQVSFAGGKLKKLQVNDVYNIDGQLAIQVEPPKEIKNDLGQKYWYLKDSNWEPDFPTSARQAEWFYTKETGERVEGVLALDISAMEDLLSAVGTLDLADYNLKIDAGNLFEKAVSAKKNFLTALTSSLFNKLFFLPNINWPAVMSSLGRSLERKHVSVYLDNPILFSYILSQGWGGLMPRPGQNEKNADFLALVEANLGVNYANYYLDRNINLETVIGQDGEVSHKLRIAYLNRSPAEVFPAGKYKNRMRIYLPMGAKLAKASWGEADITKTISSFVDYGRSGYSLLIELMPKEAKTLVLDWSTPIKLEFTKDKADYKLDVVKQAGTLKDPFAWRVTYPINMKLVSDQAQTIGPQEYSVKGDLSTDKTFQLEFTRP